MSTNWTLPTLIEQYEEPGAEGLDIAWINIDNLKYDNNRYVSTVRDLVHIAREPKHDIQEKTYFLSITGFNFTNLPSAITGIEMKLETKRFGRITDDTIQLTLNGGLRGDNRATSDLNPIKLYGGETDLWESKLTITDVLNSSFGVALRFKSHPLWPHKTGALVETVQLRVY